MNHPNLKTYIKKTKNKGIGVFANKNIKKGETICYYMVKIVNKLTTLYSDINYRIGFQDDNGELIENIVGDVDSSCWKNPTSTGIAYWGYLANEPSVNQTQNSVLKKGYNNKKVKDLKIGDHYLYKIVSTKSIRKNEEVTWYYGDRYQRNYKTSGKLKSK
jgi:SET domain